MKIYVTKKDIANGVEGDSTRCPIAKAIRRETGVRNIQVEYKHVVIGDIKCSLPTEAQNFIAWFDIKKSVKPFSFNMRPVK